MNRKISVGMAISITAIVAAIAIMLTYSFALNKFESRMAAITDRESTYDLITEVDNKIRQKYYGTISDDSLRIGIADGFIAGLGDSNCAYYTAESWELEKDRAAGYDFGLGMDVAKTAEGQMHITRIQSGSPAHNSGLRIGDVIYQVNGEAVQSIGYEKALENISNAASDVKLSIERNGAKLDKTVSITKSRYTIASVEYSVLPDNIGKIIIYSFNALTSEQFNTALRNLQKEGIEGLIIDLRGNSGSDYESASQILDTLVGSGRLMIVTDRNGNQTARYMSVNSSVDLKYSVLIDENTSGAAELFASDMYDFTGCDLVGATTAGQRMLLEDFELSDGSAIRLSTGVWTTPKASQLTDDGVTPTFPVQLTSYQRENLRLLATNDDPQIYTALSRLKSMLEEDEPVSAADAADDSTASATDSENSD